MKRVLIHTLIFSPDGVSTAYLYNDIALRLQQRGYEVVVLSTTPHFNILPEQVAQQPMHWKIWGLCKVSKFHGMTVLQCGNGSGGRPCIMENWRRGIIRQDLYS